MEGKRVIVCSYSGEVTEESERGFLETRGFVADGYKPGGGTNMFDLFLFEFFIYVCWISFHCNRCQKETRNVLA